MPARLSSTGLPPKDLKPSLSEAPKPHSKANSASAAATGTTSQGRLSGDTADMPLMIASCAGRSSPASTRRGAGRQPRRLQVIVQGRRQRPQRVRHVGNIFAGDVVRGTVVVELVLESRRDQGSRRRRETGSVHTDIGADQIVAEPEP